MDTSENKGTAPKKKGSRSVLTKSQQKQVMTPKEENFVNAANTTIVGTETAQETVLQETAQPVTQEAPSQASELPVEQEVVTQDPKQPVEQDNKAKRGRPALGITKRKVTFDMPVNLIEEMDRCVAYYGMTRASYVLRAVMQYVREDQVNIKKQDLEKI